MSIFPFQSALRRLEWTFGLLPAIADLVVVIQTIPFTLLREIKYFFKVSNERKEVCGPAL